MRARSAPRLSPSGLRGPGWDPRLARRAAAGPRRHLRPLAGRSSSRTSSTPRVPRPGKWGYELGYIRNNEKRYYTSRVENVRAEGGNLVIEGRKEVFQGFGYTSASINTRGRFEFLYGRVEVRAKLPAGAGAWPAVWMLGTSIAQVGWPTCGEIDIMENVGFDPLRIHGSIHTAAYNHTIGTQKTGSVTLANPADDFHLYSMEWFADHIDMFVDGQKYFSFRNEGTGARVAIRQAAIPAHQSRDRRILGWPERNRRLAPSIPLRRRLREDLSAEVTWLAAARRGCGRSR